MAGQSREPLEAILERLKQERDAADARYNEALTALDRTLRPAAPLPRPAPGLDDHQIAPLNEAWNILPAPPEASGLRRKLTGFVWGVVAPVSAAAAHVQLAPRRSRQPHRGGRSATRTAPPTTS